MEPSEKIELNKLIRKYEDDNLFLISLKKQLTSKHCHKEDFNGKMIKILSDKQYGIAKSLLR